MTQSSKEKKSTKKPTKNRRKDVKYPALDPQLNLKTRHDQIADVGTYLDQLNDEEKAWLNSFIEEEVNANFNHSGVKLNDSSDPATRKRIYLNNNARNRDIMTREHAQGTLNYLFEIEEKEENEANGEAHLENTWNN